MKKKQVLVLGAYGCVGTEAIKYLLKTTDAHITLASRRSQALPENIGHAYLQRLTRIQLDAMDTEQLTEACQSKDLVISCIGPSGIVGDAVAMICKETQTPLVDAGGYDPVLHSLEKAEQKEPSLVPLIINVGLLPGLSGMFPQYVIEQSNIDQAIEQLDIQYVGRDAWSYNSAWDIINGIGDFGNERGFCYFSEGSIINVPMGKAGNKAILPSPVGKVSTMLIYAEEIVRFAKQNNIKTAKVFGANIGPKAMFVCLIAKIFKMYKSHSSIAKAAKWLVNASAKDMKKLEPAYGVQVDIQYDSGSHATGKILLSDTYEATGVIMGITARSVLEGMVNNPGVYMLHEAINPQWFMQCLEDEGLINVKDIEVTNEISLAGAA